MATPTTTYPLIRNQWATVVAALTPSFLDRSKFRHVTAWTPAGSFREWAESKAADCLRCFAIARTGPRDLPEVTDNSKEMLRSVAEMLVAYPKQHALYSRGLLRDLLDLEDVIDADAEQINAAIGIAGADNYLDGQCYCAAIWEIEEAQNVFFCRFDLEVVYYRAV